MMLDEKAWTLSLGTMHKVLISRQSPTPDLSIGLLDREEGFRDAKGLGCSRVQWQRALHILIQRFALGLVM